MLQIDLPEKEIFSELTNEFIVIPSYTLKLEHSLISLHKWEMKWHKPFLQTEKNNEEILDYVRCMSLDPKIDDLVIRFLPPFALAKILEYIKDKHTATWFSENRLIGGQVNSRETITAEIIYYWMVTLNIPVEFEKWHLESLLTLIKVVTLKNQPNRKIDPKEAARQRAELNMKRRKMWNSKG